MAVLQSSYRQRHFMSRLLLILCAIARLVESMPVMLIDSGQAKCVSVDGARDTVISVQYEAPDLVTDEESEDYAKTFLTINVNPTNRVMDTKNHHAPIRDRLKPQNHQMIDRTGSLTHKFEVDGTAAICIRASGASPKNIMRFGLRVLETEEEETAILADVDAHLSQMEKEMRILERAMKAALAEANFAKEREAVFHQQTTAMNKAAMFWPIVQTMVLLITGFTQASHIVRFFQSRRII